MLIFFYFVFERVSTGIPVGVIPVVFASAKYCITNLPCEYVECTHVGYHFNTFFLVSRMRGLLSKFLLRILEFIPVTVLVNIGILAVYHTFTTIKC
jgi:hypothetical protein